MNSKELSERLGRPALWISRIRKRFGMQILEDSRYRRLAVLLLARSRSLQLRSHALLSIRSSESWEQLTAISDFPLSLFGLVINATAGSTTTDDPMTAIALDLV